MPTELEILKKKLEDKKAENKMRTDIKETKRELKLESNPILKTINENGKKLRKGIGSYFERFNQNINKRS